ncbi:membrane protein [Tritrichomonas foetus]|uniref:Membrane protein n=1 Tax=Tritrichomonas foetus TaxID=1144522 RepID=A0A1J4JJ77_9EUKA|nr:membrane protein [Tritrichomonas foetus]|eukprot:OHS99202.1 membrane protein [Tritrichomonas foetus]
MINRPLDNQNEIHVQEVEERSDDSDNQKIPNADSKFRQQRVPACRPFLTPLSAAIIYGVFCVISLTFGLIYFKASDDIFELEIPYSNECQTNSSCQISFTVNEDRKGPFFIYYQLTNFYQNNFMYGDSKNWDQLRGKAYKKESNLDSCAPVIKSADGENFTTTVFVPCGAVPHSVFNDSFIFSAEFPTVSDDGITLSTYRKLFNEPNEIYNNSNHWMNTEMFPGEQTNPHFINWMQLAPFSTFRKLFAKTESDVELKKGEYSVLINNNFPVAQFDGTKSIIIAQVEWIGGKNRFFGIFFFVMCGISGFAALLFMILYFTNALPLYRALKNSGGSLDMSLVN